MSGKNLYLAGDLNSNGIDPNSTKQQKSRRDN